MYKRQLQYFGPFISFFSWFITNNYAGLTGSLGAILTWITAQLCCWPNNVYSQSRSLGTGKIIVKKINVFTFDVKYRWGNLVLLFPKRWGNCEARNRKKCLNLNRQTMTTKTKSGVELPRRSGSPVNVTNNDSIVQRDPKRRKIYPDTIMTPSSPPKQSRNWTR